MALIELLGYLSFLFVGVSLGLLGGGGAIIIIPILVYLLKKDTITATSYSLFIVSTSAFIGFYRNIKKQLIDFRTGIIFGIPDLIATYLIRRFIVPSFPETLFTIGTISVSRDMGIMIFFAIVIFIASFTMIISHKPVSKDNLNNNPLNYYMILGNGIFIGVITGFIGIGGGFLIVPALVLLANLSIKKAVGTSLMIIATKSAIGFIGSLQAGLIIEWKFLFIYTILAIVGVFIGQWLTNHIPSQKLKRLFGFFALIMATFIIVKELWLEQ